MIQRASSPFFINNIMHIPIPIQNRINPISRFIIQPLHSFSPLQCMLRVWFCEGSRVIFWGFCAAGILPGFARHITSNAKYIISLICKILRRLYAKLNIRQHFPAFPPPLTARRSLCTTQVVHYCWQHQRCMSLWEAGGKMKLNFSPASPRDRCFASVSRISR